MRGRMASLSEEVRFALIALPKQMPIAFRPNSADASLPGRTETPSARWSSTTDDEERSMAQSAALFIVPTPRPADDAKETVQAAVPPFTQGLADLRLAERVGQALKA